MVNVQPNQSVNQETSDTKTHHYSENNLPVNDNTDQLKSGPVKVSKSFIVLVVLSILLILSLGIFSTVMFNKNLSKIKVLEELTVKNSRQLANLNDLLGQALDANKEDELVIPPLNLKLSLEFFQHLNELLEEVDSLTFINATADGSIDQAISTQVKPEPTKRTANAEVRWWRNFFNQFLIPLKNYFSELVHVQVIDSPVSELAMTNTSQALLKKELTLRLLTIRQLVLNGLSHEASIEVKEVHANLVKNFDLNDNQVKKFIAKLDLLSTEIGKMKEGFQPNQSPLKAK
jgi:uncharacterized protein HemX